MRVQRDPGATVTAGPKDIAKALEMKETEMSERDIGYVAANGSSSENYGEKKIVGYTDDGDGVSTRAQHADVKKALSHKMNLEGNVVALDGGRSHTQNNENAPKTRINYDGGQCVMHLRLPAKEKEAQEETDKILKGNRFAILPRRASRFSDGGHVRCKSARRRSTRREHKGKRQHEGGV